AVVIDADERGQELQRRRQAVIGKEDHDDHRNALEDDLVGDDQLPKQRDPPVFRHREKAADDRGEDEDAKRHGERHRDRAEDVPEIGQKDFGIEHVMTSYSIRRLPLWWPWPVRCWARTLNFAFRKSARPSMPRGIAANRSP